MEFVTSTLPWSGTPVWRSDGLRAYLGERLVPSQKYLPASISLFVDQDVPEASVDQMLTGMTQHLEIEFARRAERKQRFVELGLITENELEAFLVERTHLQPWALYYSTNGGLGGAEDAVHEGDARGVIPCSSMRNHGVAWEQTEQGEVRTWLATSRRPNTAWDWESDIGHESAHSAFAQVPLFVQSSPRIPDDLLSTLVDPKQITPLHVAQILYLWSELAVVSMRGEHRPTATGLPVTSSRELLALLQLSAFVSGDGEFEEAAAICEAKSGMIDVNKGDDIFRVAAPIIRALPHASGFVNDAEPPSLTMLQDALSVAR